MSKQTTRTHREKKKQKGVSKLSKLRVLVMVTENEMCEAKLFRKDGGIGKDVW